MSNVINEPVNEANLTGIVFDIQRYSLGDGRGIRTTVFMKGCNLSCKWCQNPESLIMGPEIAYRGDRCIQCGACVKACPRNAIRMDGTFRTETGSCASCGNCAEVCPTRARYRIGSKYTVRELFSEVQRDAVFFAESGGGITLSGGEATIQSQFVAAFLRLCQNTGIKTAIETNGFFDRERFTKLLPFLDQIFFDIKMISPAEHQQYTGAHNDIILDNAGWLARRFTKLTFRTPLVQGMTLTDPNMKDIAAFLIGLKVKTIELCLYQNSWEKKLQWLNTRQEPLNLAPLLPWDVAGIIEFFANSGIEAKII